jgi:hypothetical protein
VTGFYHRFPYPDKEVIFMEREISNSTKLIESRLFVSLILDKYLSDTTGTIDKQDMSVMADLLAMVENCLYQHISAMEEAATA